MNEDRPVTDLTDADDVRRELIVLAERLEALPKDAFDERLTVRMRQDELRNAVRSISLDGDLISADQLERRIADLRREIEDHYGNRISHSSGPQTGLGGGIDPRYLHQMNRLMDQAANIDTMKQDLRKHEDRLKAMRGEA